MFINKTKNYIFLFFFFHINIASYILSGIKTLNKFLYLSRFKNYYKQSKTNTCSLSDNSNCYYTEKNYISNIDIANNYDNVMIEDWNGLIEKIELYGINNIYFYYINKTKEYLLKNKNEIDRDQNSQGEKFNYLLTFNNYDEITKSKDIYYEEIESEKQVFYNKEIIIEIKGKLRLSYDKDVSEAHLQILNIDYPSNTYGFIESKFISISFQGKFFLCDFVYIKAHNKKDRKESIYFLGYIGNRAIFSQSYTDNKKRNEKWLKLGLQTTIPINLLVISGPYDIDNFSFTFPNKEYDDTNLYRINNYENLINDEDI